MAAFDQAPRLKLFQWFQTFKRFQSFKNRTLMLLLCRSGRQLVKA